ncbi:MAG: hypothetical protein CBC13_06480 [Planctomycetia bacterium TMED53]|nr:MAG: hypothetical protein CBC13_06480 [Planctomycetia bacterium TMED53]
MLPLAKGRIIVRSAIRGNSFCPPDRNPGLEGESMKPTDSAEEVPRRVIVTGASRGLGRVLARHLAKANWRVGVIARSSESLEELLSEGQVEAVEVADLTDENAARHAIESLATTLGGLDALINNAGKVYFEAFEEMQSEQFLQVLKQNLMTAVNSSLSALPHLKRSKKPSLIQISSISGIQPLPGGSAYSAAKHGLVGWSRSIFSELRQQGIRVSLIHPGSIAAEPPSNTSEGPSDADPLDPVQIAQVVLQQLEAPPGTVLSEVEIRPLKPPRR